jgi:pimeloyl-ACP methyl ester carboxylesterase
MDSGDPLLCCYEDSTARTTMTAERVHRAASADGTEIGGRVEGDGPPLVLVHSAPHDGDIAWEAMLPHLTGRFTCYLPSLRGVGLSGDNPDHSPPRLEEDVNSFVDSIGEPVALVGFSTSGPLVLGAAIHSAAVAAVGVYDLLVGSVMQQEDLAGLGAMLEQMSAAAADGRLVEAARTSHRHSATDDEFAALEANYLGGEYFQRCAPIVPAALQWVQQGAAYDGPLSADPELLAQLAVPVLVLRGRETLPWLGTVLANSEQHAAHHLADLHVREPLPGLGHYAPLLAPERIARELIAFFELVR